jgi:hypothetical protein
MNNPTEQIKLVLSEIEQGENAATLPPWNVETFRHSDAKEFFISGPRAVLDFETPKEQAAQRANAAFIAHARCDVPRLCRALEMAVEALERMDYANTLPKTDFEKAFRKITGDTLQSIAEQLKPNATLT